MTDKDEEIDKLVKDLKKDGFGAWLVTGKEKEMSDKERDEGK